VQNAREIGNDDLRAGLSAAPRNPCAGTGATRPDPDGTALDLPSASIAAISIVACITGALPNPVCATGCATDQARNRRAFGVSRIAMSGCPGRASAA
jgi:hypothetical protein